MAAEDWEEDEAVRAPRKKRVGAVREAVEVRTAQISFIGPRGCQGLIADTPVYIKPQTGVAIGDLVEIDPLGTIQRTLPRKTVLSRNRFSWAVRLLA